MKRKIVLTLALCTAMLAGCGGNAGSIGQQTTTVENVGTDGQDMSSTKADGDMNNNTDESGADVEDGEMTEEKQTDNTKTLSASEIKTGVYKNAVSCHDPQIVLGDDGSYYMTGSHQVLAKSDDLNNWTYIGNGNNVFSNLFSGNLDAFKYVGKNDEGGYSVWAANTYYNETMQKYVMYFCTTSTYIKSNLCMAVSDTPGGKYEYTDTILYSGFTGSTAAETNIFDVLGADADISEYLKLGGYDNNRWPNCIDPAVFTDENDRMWMVYGSWSGGIFLLELDPATGQPIHEAKEGDPQAESFDPYFGYKLVGGGHHAIEGPYLTYSPESGYYHLFLSYGGLTSDGGYQIRQFRSKNPMGPYVDAAGNTLGDEEDYMNYGLKMMGNYTLPSLSVTYMAPGGQSVFQDPEGNYYITYHQRFDDGKEFHEPRVHRLFLTEDGWFTASPFELSDDELAGDKVTDISDFDGAWYVLDHGISVSKLINKPVECTVENGAISGEETDGTIELIGDSKVKLTVNGESFEGVIIDMTDEAGNKTRSISAVGANNHTIWAVEYLK